MINHTEIIAKYNEFKKGYSNEHIDDYETFIRSRVIEYFFRLSHYSIDKLTFFVNTTLDEEKRDSLRALQQESAAMNDKEVTAPLMHGEVSSKKLLPILLLIVFAVGVLGFIFCRKK